MSDNPIAEHRTGALVTLGLQNPPYNPIGVAQVAGLREAMTRLGDERGVRAVLITGAGGKHFSVGANLKEADQVAIVGSRDFCAERHALYQQIEDMSKPVVAAIRGYCLGGGLELALACHFRLADATAQLGLPEVDLGAAPMWGGAYRIVRAVGRARGLEMLLSGDMIDAETALKWGLVNQVVPLNNLESATMTLARKLAQKSPLALQMGKQAFYNTSDMEFGKALEYSNEMFAALCVTQDATEGINAFLEKRKPVWQEK